MNESTATRFQREQRRSRAAGVAGGLLVSAVLALTPGAGGLADWARSIASALPPFLAGPAALVVFSLSIALLWEAAARALGRAAAGGFDRRPASFDARGSALSPSHVATGVAVRTGVGVLFGIVVIASSRVAPPFWWLVTAVIAGAALIVALQQSSTWLAQASGARPIDRPALVEELGGLARKIRVPIQSIDRLPAASTLTASAMVTGAGERRRVFIADDLMRDWKDEEIAVVVAHELAHHAHRDLWITVVVDGLVLGGAFRAAEWARTAIGAGGGGPIGLAELPLVALTAGAVWIASAPLRHALSRWQERRADTFALNLTGRPDAFQAAVRRLAATHLAEERPSRLTRWMFHRHPSAAERLAAAAAFERVNR
jgi:STE24 endopeptidase